jgi:hypothetical protein
VFTVEELIRWINEHKLVKFVEEERDHDMDRIMEGHASGGHKNEDSKNEPSPASETKGPLP